MSRTEQLALYRSIRIDGGGFFFPGILSTCHCTRTVLMSSSVLKEQIGGYWSHSLKSFFSEMVGKHKYGFVAEELNKLIYITYK